MFVTDVVVEKNSLNLINAKIKISFTFLFLMGIGFAAALAMIIAGLVNKVTDYNTYLFSAFGMAISVFWFFVSFNEYKKSRRAAIEIMERGSHTITGAIEVNADRKYNTFTIMNFVCAILVLVCFIVEIVLQIVEFNILTLYILPITFILGLYMTYQTAIGLINDKMYRQVIFQK